MSSHPIPPSSRNNTLPRIVSAAQWQQAHDALLVKEKQLTRAKDALAAERRRMPMVRIDERYVFDGAEGAVSLLDLFEGRRQLLLYHFMFAPTVEGWPAAGCPGCSMVLDNIGQFALAHLNARDVSFAAVSRGPFENIVVYQRRMGWPARWVSSAGNSFNDDFGVTTEQGEDHGLSVFLRDGVDIYRTYFTKQRGMEGLGSSWSFLDLMPFGRQETWEDSPADWPQDAPYQWWRLHDEYPVASEPATAAAIRSEIPARKK